MKLSILEIILICISIVAVLTTEAGIKFSSVRGTPLHTDVVVSQNTGIDTSL